MAVETHLLQGTECACASEQVKTRKGASKRTRITESGALVGAHTNNPAVLLLMQVSIVVLIKVSMLVTIRASLSVSSGVCTWRNILSLSGVEYPHGGVRVFH